MNVLLKLNKGGELLYNLNKLEHLKVIGFYARSPRYIGTSQEGGSVYSIYEAVEMYKKQEFSAFIISAEMSMESIRRDADTLKYYGVKIDNILIALPEFKETGKEAYLLPLNEYRRLPYIEYHVSDHCNLNCRGCVHFSPLAGSEYFPIFDHVEKDLRQLKKIVPYIDTIRILGGEPFLNPELSRYMKITREIYPYANISVVTNGLLLGSCDFFDDFVKYCINIDISLYKPLISRVGEMLKMLQERGIAVSISEPIEEFSYALDKSGGHARFARRHNCSCPNLYEGGLYVCPIIAYVKYFNRAFGYQFNDTDGRIDIYDSNMNFTRLCDELHRIRQLCDNCLFISGEHIVT